MKKRHLISAVAMILALMLLSLSGAALAEEKTFGALSYLNVTEGDEPELGNMRRPLQKLLLIHGVLEKKESRVPDGKPVYHYYDSLNAMLMGLQAGEVIAIKVPSYTAKYLCAADDTLMAIS